MRWLRSSGQGDEASGPAETEPERLTRTHLVILFLILAAGLALRAGCLAYALQTPGYTWDDPDGYALQARRLARPDGWQWTFQAVTYRIHGQRHALPPLYSVFLSVFALFPGFPVSAIIAQILLSVVSIWLVFMLGRLIHSTTAGLLAASGAAAWVPSIFNVWSTSQETLYIPIMLAAFLLLGRLIDRDARPGPFLIPGAVFGIAALTRSMPLFFVVPAACAHIALARDRRRASLQSLAFLAGFLAVIGPYSAALSSYFGQLTVIDTHGGVFVAPGTGSSVPMETARALWLKMAGDPVGFFTECLARARSLMHVNGGRILQIYVLADTWLTAIAWKVLVHLGSDFLLIVSGIAAPFGAALCRGRRLAVLFLLWTVINISIASLAGYGGARLRAPFEPLLLVLAGVVFSGGWRPAGAVALSLAGAAAALVAVAVVPQVPRSVQAWPDYGVTWPSILVRNSGHFTGATGLNVPAFDGVAVFTVKPAGKASPRLDVRIGGVHVRTVQLTAGQPTTIRSMWPAGGLAFVELEDEGTPQDGTGRSMGRILVTVGAP
jgi:hypothetical protein